MQCTNTKQHYLQGALHEIAQCCQVLCWRCNIWRSSVALRPITQAVVSNDPYIFIHRKPKMIILTIIILCCLEKWQVLCHMQLILYGELIISYQLVNTVLPDPMSSRLTCWHNHWGIDMRIFFNICRFPWIFVLVFS